jgi:hypothetical protein
MSYTHHPVRRKNGYYHTFKGDGAAGGSKLTQDTSKSGITNGLQLGLKPSLDVWHTWPAGNVLIRVLQWAVRYISFRIYGDLLRAWHIYGGLLSHVHYRS